MSNSVLRTIVRLFLLVTLLLATSANGNPDLANGLGDHIDWIEWSNALAKAKDEKKPLMIIIHKAGCPACKSLKPKFSSSEEIKELSANFVMVNANNGAEPSSDPAFAPDGSYVPRILFLNSEAELLTDVINEQGNPSYRYYHYEAESVVASMKKAIGPLKEEL